MSVQHVFSSPFSEDTGTVTIFNSAGLSVTALASQLVGPNEWNSTHQETVTLSGNTLGASTVSGTNIIWDAGTGIQLSAQQAAGVGTIVVQASQQSLSAWAIPEFGGPLQYTSAGAFIFNGGTAIQFGVFGPPLPLVMSQINLPFFIQMTSSSSTISAGMTAAMAIYSLTGTSYTLMSSSTLQLKVSASSSTVSVTVTAGTTSTSLTMANTSSLPGMKWLEVPFVATLAAVGPYLLAFSSSTAGADFSFFNMPYELFGPQGVLANTVSAAALISGQTAYDRIFGGLFSVSSAAMPASIGTSGLNANSNSGENALIAEMVGS